MKIQICAVVDCVRRAFVCFEPLDHLRVPMCEGRARAQAVVRVWSNHVGSGGAKGWVRRARCTGSAPGAQHRQLVTEMRSAISIWRPSPKRIQRARSVLIHTGGAVGAESGSVIGMVGGEVKFENASGRAGRGPSTKKERWAARRPGGGSPRCVNKRGD